MFKLVVCYCLSCAALTIGLFCALLTLFVALAVLVYKPHSRPGSRAAAGDAAGTVSLASRRNRHGTGSEGIV